MTRTRGTRRGIKTGLVIVVTAVLSASAAIAASTPFTDIGNTGAHAANIEAIYNAKITLGCYDTTHYCPSDNVTRAQMASFLARGLGLSAAGTLNVPVGNARGDAQTYCALVEARPRSYLPGACRASTVTVDFANDAGKYPSVAIGSDGLPVVAYPDSTNSDLRILHCGNPACSAGNNVSVIDANQVIIEQSAMAIGTDGYPVVVYADQLNGDVLLLHCGDVFCIAPNSTVTIEDSVANGTDFDIAIGTDGFPIVMYNQGGTVIAHCLDAYCTSTTKTSLPAGGYQPSMAIGTDGFPLIATWSNGELRTIHCTNTACTASTSSVVVPSSVDNVRSVSLAIGTDGLGIISYYGDKTDHYRVAHCTTVTCSAVSTVTLDAANAGGSVSSITIGTNGLPIIGYHDNAHFDLKLARCRDLACASATLSIVDPYGETGGSPSIAMAPDGVPVIAYYDTVWKDLRIARPAAA
jgi:hypothetical protein